MKNSGIPGMAVAVVHGGKTVYAKGFGVKDVRTGDGPDNKVDPDTVFQLASVSKPMGATVVAHQVGQNAISWDTPIVSTSCRGSRCPIRWSPRWSPSATCTRTAPGCPTTPATCSRTRLRPALRAGAAARASAGSVPDLLRLHQLRADRRRRGGGRRRRQVLGGPQPRRCCTAAGHGVDQLRFADYEATARPRRRAHPRRRQVRAAATCATPHAESPAGGVSSSVNDMTQWLTMMLANGSYDGQQIVDPKALLPALTPQIVSSPRQRAGDAVGLLRLRVQRRHHVGGADAAQPFRGLRTRRRQPTSSSCRRPTWRSSR